MNRAQAIDWSRGSAPWRTMKLKAKSSERQSLLLGSRNQACSTIRCRPDR